MTRDGKLQRRIALLILAGVLDTAGAQTPIDLRLWFVESYPGAGGTWAVAPDGLSVTQSINGDPTLFCSDFDLGTGALEGTIRVGGAVGDDDYVGFAIGFAPGDSANPAADYLLVDWKSLDQTFDFPTSCAVGGLAAQGLAASRVTGIPATDEFWVHDDQDVVCSPLGHGLQELARGTTLGAVGWTTGTAYTFAFEVRPTSLQVSVDGLSELDVPGSFGGGRLCFYNFSQGDVTYEAFTLDCSPTAIAATPAAICEGDTATLDASASLPCDANGLEYRWLEGGTPACDWSPSAQCDVMPALTTTYDLEVRCVGNPACGSTDSASITVQTVPVPSADAGIDRSVCELQSLTLDGSSSTDPGCNGGLLYEWRDAATVLQPASPDPTWPPPTSAAGTTTYTLAVRCSALPWCESTDDVMVEVRRCPLAVVFDAFAATDRASGVEISWTAAREAGALGYQVERAARPSGPYEAIAQLAAHGSGLAYRVDDPDGEPDSWYRVVEWTTSGRGDATPAFTAARPTGSRRRDAATERQR